MTTLFHSYNDIDDFPSVSDHVFSNYCENETESYSSKYLPTVSPPPSSQPYLSSTQINGKDQLRKQRHSSSPSSIYVGEPFSALVPSLIPSPHLLLHDTDEQIIYDEYGFRIDINENEQRCQILPIIENEQIKHQWLDHLNATYKLHGTHLPFAEEELIEKIDPKKLKQDAKLSVLLQQSSGFPSSLRAQLWMCLSGALHKKHHAKISYSDMLKKCDDDAQLYSKQIEKDLLRTLPTNACFMTKDASGISRLRRILRTIAWLFPGKLSFTLQSPRSICPFRCWLLSGKINVLMMIPLKSLVGYGRNLRDIIVIIRRRRYFLDDVFHRRGSSPRSILLIFSLRCTSRSTCISSFDSTIST